eukprot:9968892-Heterocapsa_arctica.AAC.1
MSSAVGACADNNVLLCIRICYCVTTENDMERGGLGGLMAPVDGCPRDASEEPCSRGCGQSRRSFP